MPDHQLVTDAFTELASVYQQTMDQELKEFWGISYDDFINHFLRQAMICQDDLVLDVATGTAFIPMKLAEKLGAHSRIIGLDLTPAMLREGQRYTTNNGLQYHIWLLCASGLGMPFHSRIFDVILCALGTHHMDVPQLLEEACRVLKSNGRLFITDVGANSFWRSLWGRIILNILLIQYRLSNHGARAKAEAEAFSNVHTAREWRDLLTHKGFRDITIEEIRSRRPWYPCGLMICARKSDMPDRLSSNSKGF